LAIAPEDYKDSRLSFTESANALRDGTIDVGFWSVGPGTSSILDLATTHEIHISVLPGAADQILAANTTYSSVDLAGGVYRGVDQAGIHHRGVERDDLPGQSWTTAMVYNLVKALYEHNDYLLKIHPSAAYTTPENAVKYSPIPLHPGTIKYLKEKGSTCRPS
jgi:TRAP transporter TAXI family solute receptor